MNTERIEQLLNRQPGVDGWFCRHYRTEATTVIRLPVLVSPQSGTGRSAFEAFPNPDPREVISATTENLWLTIYSRSEQDGKTWMGEALGQLLSDEESSVLASVAPLVAGARSQKNVPYTLAPGDSEYPKVELADPALIDASSAQVLARVQEFNDAVVRAAGQEPSVQVSNLELFITRSRARISTSTGIRLEYPLTRVAAEICFVSRPDSDHTGEHTARLKARRLADLDPVDSARLCAHNARAIALAGSPPDYSGPVVLVDEAAADCFVGGPLMFHANARFVFEKSSRYERGKPVSGDTEVRGERLNLIADPLVAYGVSSEICSGHDAGPARRVIIVKDGNYEGMRGTRRYFEYLGLLDQDIGPALPESNVVVMPGRHKAEELSSGEAVIVRAFSDWQADPASGDFACEIRLGELRKQGKTMPFRGGLLVGNWFDSVADAAYSRELQVYSGYRGPQAVRFNNLKVAG